jgi:RNA polymerase sigma factor (sigma-70 family)
LNTRLIRTIARKFVTNGGAEEDLVQEGMLAYMRAEATFKPDTGVKFETYASRVIKNRFIDLLRKKSKTTTEFNDDTTRGDFDFDDEVNLIIIRKILHDDVNELERAIFNSYIEGFTYEEISKIFELPRKKIDNIVQKVKRIIKEHL